MMSYKSMCRKAFLFVSPIRAKFSISAITLFIISIAGYGIAFLTLRPNSSLVNLENYVIDPYLVMNLSIVFIVSSFVFGAGINIFWLVAKKCPPLVDVKDYFLQDTAYLRIRNNESVDLDYVQIKMLGLSIDRMAQWNAIKDFDHNNIIKIEKRIVNSEKLDIPIAVGKNGFTNFQFDDGRYNLALDNLESEHSFKKYRIILEVYAHPVNEQKSLLVGIFSGIISHDRHNGTKLFDGKKYHDDKLVYQDMVRWEKASFKEIGKKEMLSFFENKKSLAS